MAKSRLPAADIELWRLVARSVTPLKREGKARPAKAAATPPRAAPEKPAEASASAPIPPPPKPAPTPPRPPRDLKPGQAIDMDRRQAQRFQRGQMTIEAKIDLHGLTQREAHDALVAFLGAARRQDRRCLLVVTGKGSTTSRAGILKAMVPRWLNEPELRRMVLAIAPAAPRHGGEGALYVLLRRQREAEKPERRAKAES